MGAGAVLSFIVCLLYLFGVVPFLFWKKWIVIGFEERTRISSSHVLSQKALLGWRIVAALFLWVWTLYGYESEGFLGNSKYLTTWTMYMVSLALTVSGVEWGWDRQSLIPSMLSWKRISPQFASIVTYIHMRDEVGKTEEDKDGGVEMEEVVTGSTPAVQESAKEELPLLEKITIVLYSVGTTTPFVITLAYWLFVYSPPLRGPYSVVAHGIHAVLAWTDQLLGNVILPLRYWVLCLSFGAMYAMVSIIRDWACPPCEPVYSVLNWDNGKDGKAALYFFVVWFVSFLAFWLSVGLIALREKYLVRARKASIGAVPVVDE